VKLKLELEYKVKDIKLSKKGSSLIEWASNHMPVLAHIRKRFSKEKPLNGIKIGACLHVTKETAVLVETLKTGGAEVALCGSNPLSTQDEVAAAIAKLDITVFAWRAQTTKEYYWCINKVLDFKPMITMDDGADLVGLLHSERKNELKLVKGGTEETTTGVIRLKNMEKEGALKYPIIAVNDAHTKFLFDNRYGTGQSSIDGILRSTNVLLAGKKFVVCGYGWCGRGISFRARGMGAQVIVVEVNHLRALEAIMDGFQVMPLLKAAGIGDIFITATGNFHVINDIHIQKMKDGAIICNSGHFNVEINMSYLEQVSTSKRILRPNLVEYTLNGPKKIFVLAEGRLVNLASAEGHPSEVMDMSFSNQALCVEHIINLPKMEPKVYNVPQEIDELVANLKLESMSVEIDEMTEEQKNYISNWNSGTN
jgi:adenosylhomocysteinase